MVTNLPHGPHTIDVNTTVSSGNTLSGDATQLRIGAAGKPGQAIIVAVAGSATLQTTSITDRATLSLQGHGARWTDLGTGVGRTSLTLGNNAKLLIGAGAALLDDGGASLATARTDNVFATVAGGSWTVKGLLDVGAVGAAHVSLSAGALLTAGGGLPGGATGLVIGGARTGSGVLDVGTGATLSAGQEVIIGLQGHGALLIDGGTATLGAGARGLVLGDSANAVGVITVSHHGSLTVNGTADVGESGRGSIDVTNGTLTINDSLVLGLGAGGQGILRVGSEGVVNAKAGIVDGDLAGGHGSVVVDAGGSLNAGPSIALGGGALIANPGGAISVGLQTTDGIAIGSGDKIVGFGTIVGDVAVKGDLAATFSTLVVNGVVSGVGTVEIASKAELDLDRRVAADVHVTFDAAGVLKLGDLRQFEGTATHFGLGDEIVVGPTAASITFDAVNDVIHVFGSGGAALGTIDVEGDFSKLKPVLLAGGTIEVGSNPGCFVTGTRLAAEGGEIAVEALRVGDLLRVASGALRPVRWIGHRHLPVAEGAIAPVRIVAGAFAPGLPTRDLYLSPDHCLLCDDVLVPVKALVNGTTIATVPRARNVTYWHVELDSHDVLLAEGLAAESFLESGNRGAFTGSVVDLVPDFSPRSHAAACRPVVTDGAALTAAKSALLDRAARLGHAWTSDEALAIEVAGTMIAPDWVGDCAFFTLPAADSFRIVSHAAVPAETMADSTDPRRLGVAVATLVIDGVAIDLSDPRLGAGWHAAEPGLRWTDGAAEIRIAGVRDVDLRLVRGWLRYPAPGEASRLAA